jgi:hypothetical protein
MSSQLVCLSPSFTVIFSAVCGKTIAMYAPAWSVYVLVTGLTDSYFLQRWLTRPPIKPTAQYHTSFPTNKISEVLTQEIMGILVKQIIAGTEIPLEAVQQLDDEHKISQLEIEDMIALLLFTAKGFSIVFDALHQYEPKYRAAVFQQIQRLMKQDQ